MSNKKRAKIDYSDIPATDANFWSDAKVIIPKRKKSITLRLDAEVLDWFKNLGSGYQTQINAVLKTYVDVSKN